MGYRADILTYWSFASWTYCRSVFFSHSLSFSFRPIPAVSCLHLPFHVFTDLPVMARIIQIIIMKIIHSPGVCAGVICVNRDIDGTGQNEDGKRWRDGEMGSDSDITLPALSSI